MIDLPKLRIAIIGAGAVGTSLALLLQQQSYAITGIISRSEGSAVQAAKILQTDVVPMSEICQAADFVFITTPDREIGNVVTYLTDHKCLRPGLIIAHTSGVHSSALLSLAKESGAHILSFHPLQSFSHPTTALVNLQGSIFTLEGDIPALAVAREMVESLGGQPVIISPEQKTLYHAGACAASNYFVAIVHLAVALLKSAGFQEATAQEALLPLLRGTLNNLEKTTVPQALTGPIARGDASTVAKHLQAITASAPQLLPYYQHLAHYTIGVAQEKQTLSPEEIQTLYQTVSTR